MSADDQRPPAAAFRTGFHDQAAERAFTALHDGDRGLFRIRTVTATYLLDMDARCLLRAPGHFAPDAPDGALRAALARHFDIDGTWLDLITLNQCEVGAPLRAKLRIDGLRQPLRSTQIQSIHRVSPQASARL